MKPFRSESRVHRPSIGTSAYVWKTDKAWAGTCRQLVRGSADGSFQRELQAQVT